MLSKFKRLGKDSVVYGIAGIVTKSIGFLLLPLYTRIFTPSDYGIMDVIATMTSLAGIILISGTDTALSYFYFKTDDYRDRQRTITSLVLYLLVVNAAVAAVVCLFAEEIVVLSFNDASASFYLQLAVLSIPFTSVVGLNMNILRLNRQPWLYAAVSLSQFIATLLFNIILIVFLKIGIVGIFITNLATSLLFALVSTIINRRYYAIGSFSMGRLRQVVGYGLPLVLGGLSMWTINCADRYFLLKFSTIHDVGLYSVGLRLASVAGFVTWAFRLANAPFQFEISSDKDALGIYSRTLTYFVLLTSVCCVFMGVFARPLLYVLATEAYAEAFRIVGLACFSAVAYGLYQIVGVGLLLEKKTGFTGLALGAGALLNLVFLRLLVPGLGITGAALAVLCTHIIVVLVLYCGAQKAYPIPYELGVPGKILCVSFATLLAGAFSEFGNLYIDLITSFVLFGAYLLVLVKLKLLPEGFVATLRGRLYGVSNLIANAKYRG